jgi:spoIIIJ-associated protein
MADYQTIENIQATIKEVLENAGIQARVEYEDSLSSGLTFNIFTRDAKMLIGRQGTTLHALEHLIHSIVSKKMAKENPEAERVFFSIDVDDYKRNRQYQIKQMIKDSVSVMKRSGKPAKLPPMSNYERKFVHMYVQEQFPHVTTTSMGIDPNRYIELSI